MNNRKGESMKTNSLIDNYRKLKLLANEGSKFIYMESNKIYFTEQKKEEPSQNV